MQRYAKIPHERQHPPENPPLSNNPPSYPRHINAMPRSGLPSIIREYMGNSPSPQSPLILHENSHSPPLTRPNPVAPPALAWRKKRPGNPPEETKNDGHPSGSRHSSKSFSAESKQGVHFVHQCGLGHRAHLLVGNGSVLEEENRRDVADA